MNLAELNRRLSVIDNHFHFVNHGGCGCVAALLARKLSPVITDMRITSSFVEPGTDLDELRPQLGNNLSMDEWNDNGVYFGHLWVEIQHEGQWYALDSTGVTPIHTMYFRYGPPADGSFTLEEAEAFMEDAHWNPLFDRRQIPAIAQYIDTHITVD